MATKATLSKLTGLFFVFQSIQARVEGRLGPFNPKEGIPTRIQSRPIDPLLHICKYGAGGSLEVNLLTSPY